MHGHVVNLIYFSSKLTCQPFGLDTARSNKRPAQAEHHMDSRLNAQRHRIYF